MPFVIISGCSSGGKSTLLDELARRGHATVPEPGRRVVREEQASGGTALPWADTRAFVDRIVALAGIGVARRFYLGEGGLVASIRQRFTALYRTLLDKYYVDEIYAAVVVRPLERVASWLWRGFDVRVIDGVVDGTGTVTAAFGAVLRLFQNGYVGTYAFFFVLGVVFLLVRMVF